MNRAQLFFLLLALPTTAFAAQVSPAGARLIIKKSWFSCACSCKPSCLRSREERERARQLAETERIFKQTEEKTAQERKERTGHIILRAQSVDLRRATGRISIADLKAAQQLLRAEQTLNINVNLATNAALSVASTARAVSPIAPLSPPGLLGSLSSRKE